MVLPVKSLHFQLLVKISETSASKTQTFPSNSPLLKNREGWGWFEPQYSPLWEPPQLEWHTGVISVAEGKGTETECAVREGGCALRVHGTGQVSAASLGKQERGKQAAGAGRMVSPLPVPCETAGSGVIVYSSSGMWDGSVNQYFTTAYLPGPCFGVAEVGQGACKWNRSWWEKKGLIRLGRVNETANKTNTHWLLQIWRLSASAGTTVLPGCRQALVFPQGWEQLCASQTMVQ